MVIERRLPKLVWRFDTFNRPENNSSGYRWYDYTWEENLFQDERSNYILSYATAHDSDTAEIAHQFGVPWTNIVATDYWRVITNDHRVVDPHHLEFIHKKDYPTYQKLRKKLELEVILFGMEREAIREIRRNAWLHHKWRDVVNELLGD